MIVGVMKNQKNPTKLVTLTSLICKSYGIEVVYMRPKDVNIETGTVKGRILIDDDWHEREMDLPPFVDIFPSCFRKKNREITDYLKRNTFLSDNRENVIRKFELQEHLKNDPAFSNLVIPTHKITEFDDLKDSIEKYKKVVLKPFRGARGKGVYVVERHGESYSIGHKFKEKHLKEHEIKQFVDEDIIPHNYMIQKYVSSKNLQGDPFDCRVHVEKNGDGKWESASNYIRIGIGQKVISNVNQGGGVSKLEPFLRTNYEDKWQEISDKLEELAVTLPYRIEELRGTHIMSLGMDVGIDQDGELYIFEVNDGPDTTAVTAEVAYLRSRYYKFILQEKLGLFKESQIIETEEYNYTILKKKSLERKKRKILKERNKLKQELESAYHHIDELKRENDKIKNSTSWHLTSPIRKAGSIRKKFNKK